MAKKATSKKSVTTNTDLASARKVLKTESDALDALGDSLGDNFIEALGLLDALQGRIVVTGMGKSGHVARKIAATLASTGHASFFVHPGEATHGDLGMIQKDDAVIALSNSGETAELSDIVAYCKRYRIPLISITGHAESTLAKAANAALVIPPSPEACPMGLAPTTSTTVMLALGDAIAVCLLERKGFSAADFHDFHPGGKLGQQLLKVGDLMHTTREMPLVGMGDIMAKALIEMSAKGFGVAGVVDAKGALIGVVTDGDLRRHMSPDLPEKRVSDVMTPSGITVTADQMASEAVAIMNERKITTLFIIENNKPIGILHIHDCLRAGVV